jgi:signal transduction histidine kinase
LKLLDLTNRYHFLSIIIILTLSGVLGYFLIKNIVNKEFNEKLYADREQFLYEWHTYEGIQESFYLNIGDRVNIEPITADLLISPVLMDTIMWDDFEKKELPFRQLKFSDKLKDDNYAITITKSLLPNEDMMRGMTEFILFLTIGLIFALTFINGRISKRIWMPFFDTLTKLDQYKITKPTKIEFRKTDIKEFDNLNSVVENMLIQSQKEYTSLKEFTENASHEIQTPLAIIKSKLEVMLQDSRLAEDQLQEISKINESVNRLSKLKTGLSLLTKLDNNQFPGGEKIELVPYIENKLGSFEEILDHKKITLTKDYVSLPSINMNATLAFVLFNNLIGNAIKHNIPNGTLSVRVTSDTIILENTGNKFKDDPETLFQRFKKGSNAHDSSGLGLALVKKICDLHQMTITYTVNDRMHRFEILLPKKNS